MTELATDANDIAARLSSAWARVCNGADPDVDVDVVPLVAPEWILEEDGTGVEGLLTDMITASESESESMVTDCAVSSDSSYISRPR